jgi:nucleotide-binding universal stress UspA family protein
MTSTIVVGYIPTPEGIAALEAAKAEALLLRARLVVVNTGDRGNFATHRFATAQDVDAIGAELARAGLDHEVVQPAGGSSAAEELLKVTADEGADLLVIGIRQRTPVGKLILGSTAQQVLLDSPCAVLAVKARRK